jgi:beta-mannosidase
MSHYKAGRRELLKTSGAGIALALFSGSISAKVSAKQANAAPGQTLNGPWQVRQAGSEVWLPATVPGTVHTDLLAAKKIGDPFYRTNERDQQWIDKADWEYRTTLDLDAETLARDHVELVFAGLDTYADVYLNEARILSADNMFREWTADIKPHAKAGANVLRIYFHSPIKAGLKRLEALGYNPPAPNDQSENGGLGDQKVSVFTRKAGYHYGWDWGPRFVTSGIWRPVTLRAWNAVRLSDLQVIQDSLTPDTAALTVMFEIISDRAGPAVIDLTSETDGAIKARASVTLARGLNTLPLKVSIAHPKLWWTNGLGEAFLYSLTGRVVTDSASDSRTVATGLRTVKIVQTPDADGTSFYVELNGVPVFMKGANYIPNDSFLPRVTHEVYDRVVKSAVDTHMNMLRVWGGGTYEDDYFYDQCDRNGILVWQDFMFACSMYPGDAAFLENVRMEAIDNVRRLRNHPSIALWVGNNEMDSAWQNDVPEGGWGWKQKYSEVQRNEMWKAYQAIFLDILPKVVAAHDSQRFYWPSSPQAAWDSSGDIRHADLSQVKQSGDIHYWDVWWGQKPFAEYRTHIGRFMSEYGFQSFPEFKTVQTYTKPEDYDIFSEVMAAHQRSSIGNGTIKNYMQRDYTVPADFQQFLYVGQVLQAEGIKVAMEAHRSRMPYCMGSLFWQINDCWPVASWSSIDYFGRWKAQQYFAVKAFDTVLVSPVLEGGKVTITAVSDHLKDKAVTLEVKTMDFTGRGGHVQTVPFTLKANRSEVVFTSDVATLLNGLKPENALLYVRIMEAESLLSDNILYFKPVKDLSLPKPAMDIRVKPLDGAVAVSLTSPVLVKNLCLGFDGHEGVFSDNFFDLLPGQTRVITFTPRGPAPTASADLTLRHMMS